MPTRITSFAVHKTALTSAILLALFSLIFLLPMILMMQFSPPAVDANGNEIQMGLPIAMLLFMPILYFIFGYLSTALMAWLYNVVAKKTGGIQVELFDVEATEQSAEF